MSDVVHTWQVPLRADPSTVDRLYAVLSPVERQHADARPETGRRRYVVAHAALRAILGRLLGIAPNRLRMATGPCDKPFLLDADVEFNLTQGDDTALVAVCRGRPVGIDLATCRPDFPVHAMAERFFPATERRLVDGPDARRAWLGLWARKEAWVKAAGTRLVLGLPVPVIRCVTRDPTGRVPGWWRLEDLPAPPGCAASLALAGARPYHVINHRQSTRDWGRRHDHHGNA
jgi:4'-phosphopantetheinyl transferase